MAAAPKIAHLINLFGSVECRGPLMRANVQKVLAGLPKLAHAIGDKVVVDIVNPLGGHSVYGWGQLSISGFSDVLERFAGGIGQVALHGWNDDSVMGTAASNGCCCGGRWGAPTA